jgi:hypothetical protein
MGKAKRIKEVRNTPVNDMGFPINLSGSEEDNIKSLISQTLKMMPTGLDFMPTPIDMYFLHEEGTNRWMTLFTLGDPANEVKADMRAETILTRRDMEAIVASGQEPLWEWLRNVSVQICIEAVLKGKELPNRIGIQLAGAMRAHDIDRDREFQDQVMTIAQQQAMQRVMGRELSE